MVSNEYLMDTLPATWGEYIVLRNQIRDTVHWNLFFKNMKWEEKDGLT